jgi:hypothetical protein
MYPTYQGRELKAQIPFTLYKCASLNFHIYVRASNPREIKKFALACPAVLRFRAVLLDVGDAPASSHV